MSEAGDTIARIQLGTGKRDADELRQRFMSFVTIGDEQPAARPLIHEHLT